MSVCRSNESTLELVLDLGSQPLGNGFLRLEDFAQEVFYPLQCGFSESSGLFQLIEQPSPDLMFNDTYKFFSGTSKAMSRHFSDFFQRLKSDPRLNLSDGLLVELGSNDGVFLKHAARAGVRHLGFEPSSGVAEESMKFGVNVTKDFFSSSSALAARDSHGRASLVYAANVMCHIADIQSVLLGLDSLLAPDGLVVFEDPYLGDVLDKGSYDQIYDEHVFLFSATAVSRLFAPYGMELIDFERISTHGGSARYWLARRGSIRPTPKVAQVLESERVKGMDDTRTFLSFAERVSRSGKALRHLIESIREDGKEVVALGATSKSTTVYNFSKIGPNLISAIYDNTPAKQGLFSPGVHIPVLSDQEFLMANFEFAFLGAWNHAAEIRRTYSEFGYRGGRWISHVPVVGMLAE